jgi:hypothetical protein
MSGRRDELDKQNLYARAREALVEQGVVLNSTRKSVLVGIVAVLGNEHLDELPLLRLYLNSVDEKKARSEKLVIDRPYVMNLALRLAQQRAMAQPVLISPNSRIRYVHHD